MKTKIYSLFVVLMSVVAFTACDDWTPGDTSAYPANTGGVSCANMKLAVNETEVSISRADIDTSGYLVTITDNETGAIASYDGKTCSWTYGQMPSIFTLPVGQYTINIQSHAPESAAWSTPYYKGSAEFEVKNNQVTYIGTVTCNFAAIKVEVKYTEALSKIMDASSTVEVKAGDGALTWSAKETRFGYFIPVNENNKTIGATFIGKINNQMITEKKIVEDAKIGNYYIFTFSVLTGNPLIPGETGDIVIDPETAGIKIDYDVIESPLGTTINPGLDPIDDNDTEHPDKEEWPETPVTPIDPIGPDNPDDPDTKSITIEPDKSCENLDLDGGNNPVVDGAPYIINITAEKGIENLIIDISSTNEGFIDSASELLPMNFDMAHLDTATYDNLASIGLKGNETVLGKTEVPFNITDLVPLLGSFAGTHTFKIAVTDKEGNTLSKSLILKAE